MANWSNEIIEVLKTYSGQSVTAERRPMKLTDIRNRIVLKYNPNIDVSEITEYDKPTYKMVKNAMYALIEKENMLDEKDRRIRYTESKKGYKGAYYYDGGISTAELRFLIDSILHSNLFSGTQAKELCVRLQDMAGIHLGDLNSYIGSFGDAGRDTSLNTLGNLELLLRAIRQRKQVSFVLNCFVIENKQVKLKPIEIRGKSERTVNPHHIVMNNGRYYLLATYRDKIDKQTKIYYYRVDLMSGVKVKAKVAPSSRYLSADESSLKRSEYLLKHPYMFSGPMSYFRLKVDPDVFTQVVDWFGNNLTIVSDKSEEEPYITVDVTAAKKAMHYWLLQYGETIKAVDMDEAFSAEMEEAAKSIFQKYRKQ